VKLRPISLRDANDYVFLFHRHHGPVQGAKFAIAVVNDAGWPEGVVIVGRPVARRLDDGVTAEVTRLCTEGARNACSMLYGAAWRAAKAMGYRRIITYILAEENGASLRAAGWRLVGEAGGGSWSREDRPREDKHPTGRKWLYEATVV
jgi:hypothetical protein